MNQDYLFRTYSLDGIIQNQANAIVNRIKQERNEYLSNVDIEEYLDYIQQTYQLQCPILCEDNIVCDQQEAQIERYDQFFSQINYVDGILFTVTIPFEGLKEAFLSRASTFGTMLPKGTVAGNNLIIYFAVAMFELDKFDLSSSVQKELAEIKRYLSYAEKDIANFNARIKSIAKQEIDYKLSNYSKLQKVLKNIPYKLNREEVVRQPSIIRKVEIKKPNANIQQKVAEPELEMKEYDHIIQICSDMAKVMERSPKAFAEMEEEDLRTHFLVQLNGHYQGQATGETFNSNGKTDILIRNDNQNVFIAECKFWKGKKGYLATIDQLLGYVTYRDTKTAIFVFVKNKDFTKVCNEIKSSTSEHSNFVKYIDSYTPPQYTSAFRCEFKNENDNEKHFYLTVMAFCIPQKV